jgi:hypothetical protein
MTAEKLTFDRRNMLLGGTTLAAAAIRGNAPPRALSQRSGH